MIEVSSAALESELTDLRERMKEVIDEVESIQTK